MAIKVEKWHLYLFSECNGNLSKVFLVFNTHFTFLQKCVCVCVCYFRAYTTPNELFQAAFHPECDFSLDSQMCLHAFRRKKIMVYRFFSKLQEKTPENSIPLPAPNPEESELQPEPTKSTLVLPTFIKAIYSSPVLSTLHLPKLQNAGSVYTFICQISTQTQRQRMQGKSKFFFLYNLNCCPNNTFYSLKNKIKLSKKERNKLLITLPPGTTHY